MQVVAFASEFVAGLPTAIVDFHSVDVETKPEFLFVKDQSKWRKVILT